MNSEKPKRYTTVHTRFQACCSLCGSLDFYPTKHEAIDHAARHAANNIECSTSVYDRMSHKQNGLIWTCRNVNITNEIAAHTAQAVDLVQTAINETLAAGNTLVGERQHAPSMGVIEAERREMGDAFNPDAKAARDEREAADLHDPGCPAHAGGDCECQSTASRSHPDDERPGSGPT